MMKKTRVGRTKVPGTRYQVSGIHAYDVMVVVVQEIGFSQQSQSPNESVHTLIAEWAAQGRAEFRDPSKSQDLEGK